jgi:hypothetical protein
MENVNLKNETPADAKPVLAEVLTAQKIIQNCLDCYDLNKVQANNMTKDLALNILKDLQDSGYVR